ncbi:hypothetical protein ACFOWZ_16535 [Lentzea rhizosphaerae]|uniref:Uncharacterized protein n=1 Tax=Lentzea rhizosphaerae TaxID=2041025 RepID=A0ABV8BRZ8_9PSEU
MNRVAAIVAGVLAVGALALTGAPGTASAQPQTEEIGVLAGFDWNAQFACCLTSRQWTSNASGTTTIRVTRAYRINTGACDAVKIRLERWNGILWSSQGTKTATCPHPRNVSWGTGSGTYRFYIEPSYSGGAYVRANGTVSYP